MMPLSKLQPGERGVVRGFETEESMTRRLKDVGMIAGTPVLCTARSPLKDPAAFLFRGTVIALRSEDSSRIYVDKLEEREP